MKNIHRTLVIGCSLLALSACGPQDLGSPGTNGDINIGDIINNSNNTTTTTTGGGTTGGTGGVATPAASCPVIPDGLTDKGTITGPSGEWRICEMPALFTVDTTLPYMAGVLYSMNGRVDVGTDDGYSPGANAGAKKATLTIQPGVIVYGVEGVSGGSYMIVNRGSKLMAEGSATRPIIFTAETDVKGNAQDDTSALWGGVVLLGRGTVADCVAGGIRPANTGNCEQKVEGIANNIPYFGGEDNTDSSGSLKYIQIRYSGFTLELGSELQSLTLGGVGSGTKLDYIQSYNSSDDGEEMFGGAVNQKHFIAVGAEDDSVDTDSGVQANLQYVLAVQRDNVGDKALENDSPADDHGPGTTIPDALPRTLTQISNFTFWATGGGEAIQARGAGDITLADGVIYKPASSGKECISDHGEIANGTPAQVKFYSLELDCTDGAFTDTAIAAGNGSANQFLINTLTGKYLDGDNEMLFTPIYGVNPALSAFFTNESFIGAVPRPVGSDLAWTHGWTCDSTTVSFGSGQSCKSLPVYS